MAHTLACLRFADAVTDTVARLATGLDGLTPGRAGFAPAGRRIEISRRHRESSNPNRPAGPGRTEPLIRPGRRWLFDLRADPTEQRDLSAEHPENVAALERALAAHDAEQKPSIWLPSIATAKTIDKDLSVPEAADDEHIYWSN